MLNSAPETFVIVLNSLALVYTLDSNGTSQQRTLELVIPIGLLSLVCQFGFFGRIVIN
jgi:hypothetical protein